MNKEVAIELRHITKTFGNVTANKDVDMTVYKGEILAILERTVAARQPL